jgi:hypothetical protein
MSQSSYNAIGIIILKFREFIENLIDPKITELDKLKSINSYLLKEFNLSVIEITEIELDELKFKLEKINTLILDDLILLIYRNSLSKSEDKLLISLKLNNNLNQRILDLINFVELKTNKISLERNNIKNSIEHQLN